MIPDGHGRPEILQRLHRSKTVGIAKRRASGIPQDDLQPGFLGRRRVGESVVEAPDETIRTRTEQTVGTAPLIGEAQSGMDLHVAEHTPATCSTHAGPSASTAVDTSPPLR